MGQVAEFQGIAGIDDRILEINKPTASSRTALALSAHVHVLVPQTGLCLHWSAGAEMTEYGVIGTAAATTLDGM